MGTDAVSASLIFWDGEDAIPPAIHIAMCELGSLHSL